MKIQQKTQKQFLNILLILLLQNIILLIATNSGQLYITHSNPVKSVEFFGKNAGGYSNFNTYPRLIGDFNNDGQADIISFSSYSANILYNNGSGFEPKENVDRYSMSFGQASSDFAYSSFDSYPRWVGDVNGDGMDDIIGFQNDGVYVALSQGYGNDFTAKKKQYNGFGKSDSKWSTYTSYPRILGYVDNDNMIDIIGFTTDGVHIVYGNGENDFQVKGGSTLKIPNQFRAQEGYTDAWLYPRQVADINGDGLGDIIGFNQNNIDIAFQNADGTFTMETKNIQVFTNNNNWNRSNPRFVTDINKDGKADIIGFANGAVRMKLSTGRDFGPTYVTIASQYGTLSGWDTFEIEPRFVGDLNNDGIIDLIGFKSDAVYYSLGQKNRCNEQDPPLTTRDPTNDCKCNDTFYDNGDSLECLPCEYPCSNCTSPTHCLTCSTVNNRKSDNTCDCQDTFYDDDTECQPCSKPCLNCSSETVCTSCKGLNRIDNATCLCENGYYDNNTNDDCQKCPTPHKIARCSSSSTILECKPGNERTLNTSDCGCNPGFYDDGTNSDCQICQYPCENCTSDTVCTSCKTPSNRTDNTTCNCSDTFYDNDTECTPCTRPCLNCSSSNTCTSCKGQYRQNTSTCPCNEGYYDNNTDDDCQQCPHQHKVKKCSSPSHFTECKPGTERSMNTANCGCNSGYYDDLSNSDCQICPHSHKVKECSSSSNFTECKPGNERSMNTADCGCNPGYYEDGINTDCQKCLYPCLLCSSSSTTCTGTCQSPENRNSAPQCDCKLGFYDNNESCQQCDHSICATCQNSATECILPCKEGCKTCDTTSNCTEIEDGYFEYPPGTIKKCERQCSTCETSADNCLSLCQDSCGLCGQNSTCKTCIIGRYLDLQNGQCNLCQRKCFSCSDFATCTACSSTGEGRTNNLVDNCGCEEGYYEIEDQKDCVKCPSNCQICDENGDCTQCTNQNLLPPLCIEEKIGYMVKENEQGQKITEKCSEKCEQCENTPGNCLSCSRGLNRSANLPCSCQSGYHDFEGKSKDCFKCPNFCLECQNEEICLKCEELPNRSLNLFSRKCECNSGYKENSSTQECEKCYFYNGKCLSSCPFHSFLDKKTNTCQDKEISTVQNSFLIWICCTIVSIVFIINYAFKSIATKKSTKNFQKNLKQTEQIKQ